MLLFPMATKAAQNLPTWKSLGLGLIGVVVYQGVYFIFIR
jgi:CHASE1-domain containing sensor protein